MNFRERAVCIFKALIKNKNEASLRELAEQTSIPKSSVHRHKVNQEIRVNTIGHDFFETTAGLEWLDRLFYIVVFIFGIQSGVGAETLSLFFDLILVNFYVASSPSNIRGIKKKMRNLIDIYGESQMDEILKRCKTKDLHLGGDETGFGGSLFLVLMELTSGFIFTEELVKDRKYDTWLQSIGAVLEKCKKILSFTSDGAVALLKLGEKVECKNVMDLFHLLKDVKSLFATKFHSKRRSLEAEREKLEKEPLKNAEEQAQALATIDTKFKLLDQGQQEYRNALFTISTQSHPFKNTLEAKNSKELEEQLYKQLNVLRGIAKTCEIKDKKNLLDRFERRIEASSRLNDLWHEWVEQSIMCITDNSEIKKWAKEYVLPLCYFEAQLKKSRRKERLKDYYQLLVNKAKVALTTHPLTNVHLNDDWISWAQSIALKYQRTTSAIEGRNARLAQHYFASRGVRKSHINSLTAIHNYWIKRDDGTTAAERLCGYKPPDLLEYLLKNMPKMVLPKKQSP